MKTDAGKRVLWWIVGRGAPFNKLFEANSTMAYKAGRRDVAIEVIAAMRMANFPLYQEIEYSQYLSEEEKKKED